MLHVSISPETVFKKHVLVPGQPICHCRPVISGDEILID